MTLFEILDKLSEKWKIVEEKLARFPCKLDSLPLSVERVKGKVRLCFFGRPLAECKAEEKVDAVQYLDKLVEAIGKHQNSLKDKASRACQILDKFLNSN